MQYQVIRQLRHNRQTYAVGAEIELTEAQAKYLVMSGQIKPVPLKKKSKTDDGTIN